MQAPKYKLKECYEIRGFADYNILVAVHEQTYIYMSYNIAVIDALIHMCGEQFLVPFTGPVLSKSTFDECVYLLRNPTLLTKNIQKLEFVENEIITCQNYWRFEMPCSPSVYVFYSDISLETIDYAAMRETMKPLAEELARVVYFSPPSSLSAEFCDAETKNAGAKI